MYQEFVKNLTDIHYASKQQIAKESWHVEGILKDRSNEKLKFDLHSEIEREQLPIVKKKYHDKMKGQKDSMSKEFDAEMAKFDEMAKGNSN